MKTIRGTITDISYENQEVGIRTEDYLDTVSSQDGKVFVAVSEANEKLINDRLVDSFKDNSSMQEKMSGTFTIDGKILSSFQWDYQ